MTRALQITPDDDVATLLGNAEAGEPVTVDVRQVTTRVPIARGHKVALRDLPAGANVIKYGVPIGCASTAIEAGDHVHSHNLATSLSGAQDYRYDPAERADAAGTKRTFLGYVRADGRVATRNEIWILPTVGCVGRTAQRIADGAARAAGDAIDGVHAFAHPFGCSQLGDDLSATRDMLAALADHPNAAGVLIVGLGCESNQLEALLAAIPERSRPKVRTLTAQLAGDEIDEGMAIVADLIAQVGQARRQPVPLSSLVLGVKCGGSDGFSGLTANPLVGRISDRLTAARGSVVLTEIPEIFGAEQLLMDRAENENIFSEIVALVNDFKRYFLDHGEPVSENPSRPVTSPAASRRSRKSRWALFKRGGERLLPTFCDMRGACGDRV